MKMKDGQMSPFDIEMAEKGLGSILQFLKSLFTYDQYRLDTRLEAVEAIGKAAGETRAWTEELRKRSKDQEVPDRGPEISELWYQASRKIAHFDNNLAMECMIKAYGWRTGRWDNPEYEIIPRRVEEVYAEAMALIKEYKPFLGKKAR